MSSKKLQNSEISPLGLKIRELLKRTGLRQTHLAAQIGVSPSYLTEIIKGRSKGEGFKFWDGIRRCYPQWENYFRNTVKNPPENAKSPPGSTISGDRIPREGPGELLRDEKGLYGRAKSLEMEGKHYDITEFEPENKVTPSATLTEAVKMLATILDSNDQIYVRAILSNLQAFSHAVESRHDDRDRIAALEAECEEFEKRIAEMEKKIESISDPGLENSTVESKQSSGT